MVTRARRTTQERVSSGDTQAIQTLQVAQKAIKSTAESVLNAEKLKTNNILSDLQNQVVVFNSDFKTKNSSNPLNPDAQKKYSDSIEKLYKEKRANVPALYRQEYDMAFQKFKDKNESNMEEWTISQNSKNAITDATVNIQRDMDSAQRMGEDSNLMDAINYFETQELLINENIAGLDPQKHNELYGSYKSDFFTNFINGSMNSDPAGTLKLLNEKRVKDAIRPETYNKLKDATEKKLINAKALGIQKEIANKIISNEKETRRVLEGKASYTEIYNYIQANDISKPTANFLLKAGGYEVEKEEKITPSQKIQVKDELYNKIEIATAKGEVQDFLNVQDEIYQAMDQKIITKSEGEDLINTYIIPYAETVKDATEDYSVKRGFLGLGDIGMLNVGARGINEFINELDLPGEEKDTKFKVRKASLRVDLLDSFTAELKTEIEANPKLTSIKDIEQLPKSEKITIYNNARDRAISNYAKSIGIQTENRPINDVKLNIRQNEVNTIRDNNYKAVDDAYMRTNTRKFIAVRNNNGVYQGQTSEGEILTITKKEYETLKGK